VGRRELWKYGPRGWRYTQLDVGHALGALLLVAELQGYQITVYDAMGVEDANHVLALMENVNDVRDHRESEQAQVFVLCTPITHGSVEFSYPEFLSALTQQRKNVTVHGYPNRLFLRSNHPTSWPYIPPLDRAVASGASTDPFLDQRDGKKDSPARQVFAEKDRLAHAIRARRSATSFIRGRSMSMEDLNSFLCAMATPLATMSDDSLQVGMWIQGVEALPAGRYFLCRGEQDHLFQDLSAYRVEHPALDSTLRLYGWTMYEGDGRDALVVEQVRKEASDYSCYQGIANDCNVVCSFLAPVSVHVENNPNSYRTLHWQAGLLGQLLYVNAYQRHMGATGMGCFLDPESSMAFPVAGFQPLYHFALGPIQNDARFKPLA